MRVAPALALSITVGCTSLLGIDGKYVLEATQDSGLGGSSPAAGGGGPLSTGGSLGGFSGASGGTASGGMPNTGGTSPGGTASGGSGGVTDSGADGGLASCDADAASCTSGEKCCPAVVQSGEPPRKSCVAPTPIVGCNAPDCNGCPQPPNSVAVCNAQGACDFQCSQGYVRTGTECQPSATGSGGAGGSTGATCDPLKCPASSCNIAGPFPCCTPNKTCGCTWAVGAICYKF